MDLPRKVVMKSTHAQAEDTKGIGSLGDSRWVLPAPQTVTLFPELYHVSCIFPSWQVKTSSQPLRAHEPVPLTHVRQDYGKSGFLHQT